MSFDPHDYRPLFPVCERTVYLDSAGVAPCSTRTADAVKAWVDDLAARGIASHERWEQRLAGARERAARLVGASPGEIAFVRSTAHGISLVAEGLPWEPGDEVILSSEVEYPSNVFAWQQLARRGVVVRDLPAVDGGLDLAAVADAMTGRTRVIAVSSVQFATGVRADLGALGELCRQHGALLAVDGIQSLGAFPLDAKRAGVHFVSADSHKWMLGLLGVGVLFVDDSVIDDVRPVLTGWRTTEDMWAFDGTRFQMRRDATKFEEGSLPYALIDGLDEALALLEQIGVDAIAAHITALLDRAERGLTELGCRVTPGRDRRAGILLFAPPDGDGARIADGLAGRGFSVSLRRGRVRIAPHLFNTADEIDRLVDAVRVLG